MYQGVLFFHIFGYRFPAVLALPAAQVPLDHDFLKKDPFGTRRERSPQTVASKFSTGASKSLYQARPRTVAIPKKVPRASHLARCPSCIDLHDETTSTNLELEIYLRILVYVVIYDSG